VARLLVVEDDEVIARPLAQALGREMFDVVPVTSGQAALEVVQRGGCDIVLLDLNLPDMDGLDVCRQIRRKRNDLPIVMLSARASEVDLVVGLDAGADDYVTKPFRMAELLARLRARMRTGASGSTLVFGDLTLDPITRRARTDRSELRLTPTEFSLLHVLLAAHGRAVTREALVDPEQGHGGVRALDMHMSSLRRKLTEAAARCEISTVRGVGYRLDVPGT
jgi:DNA-binding response OmpR family regulator